ncbi:MAG: PqqD family protein [Lachnospiraceae bacterium]|nr:PqqD family protein [Lachnospiraceae bacterium]
MTKSEHSSKFILEDNYVIRKIADEYVIVPIGDKIADFGGVIQTNSTVAAIWDLLKAGTTEEELVQKLLDTYEVEREQAFSDIQELLQVLLKRKMIHVETE